MQDITIVEGTNERNVEMVPIALVGWILPTGHIDIRDEWKNEAEAYDGDLSTSAGTWVATYTGGHLVLTLDPPISCSKVRVNAASYHYFEWLDPDLSIDLYYDGAWRNIWSGLIPKKTWVEIPIPAGTELVSAARVKGNEITNTYLYEFNFWSEG